MITRKLSPRRQNWSNGCAVALVAASLAMGASAFGQNYSTTFDEGGTRYPANQTGGSLSGQDGWDTNDAAKTGAASYVGQSDYVGPITYPGNSNIGSFSGYQGALGGLYHGTGAGQDLPGSPIVYLFHPYTPGASTTYVLNTDFDINFPASGTTTGTPNTTRDSFGFNFQTSALASGQLFSVNFTPDGTNPSQMIAGYSVKGVQTIPNPPAAAAILYNGVYHLRITVNVTTKMMSFTVNSTTGPTTFTMSNISLATIDPATIQQVAATWTLAATAVDGNGGYTQAGSNALILDNFSIAVPEPSTWAMLGAGVLCLAVCVRRRVRA